MSTRPATAPTTPARPRLATAEDAAAARGGAILRSVTRRLTVAILVANLAGALLVFAFLNYVVPTPIDEPALSRLNLIVFLSFLPVGVVIGTLLSLRVTRPTRAWLTAGRPPDEREREIAIRQPITLAGVGGVIWVVGAIVFAAVNGPHSVALAAEIAVVVLLGGVATCSLIYLLAERIVRPTTELALMAARSQRPVLPGVATRMVLAWAFGTGIAALGTGLVAVEFLVGAHTSPRRLAATVLFLSIIAVVAGLVLVLIAARSIADPVDSVRRALGEVEDGNVGVEVPVYDGSEVGLLQAGFNRMVAELRERDRLRDLFGRHVGEDVARDALDRGVELGGEVRDVSVLFVDVISSTALAASHDPTVVVKNLNEFFGLVVDVVTSHGGWVNKFEGDAALCVFGAPTPHPSAAAGALAAARELQARLQDLTVDAAIGVSAGRVVAGNVGAAKRFEYTVIGDAVNEAARLTELAKTASSRLLASEAIVTRVDGVEALRWRLGNAVTLRGRAAPTRIAEPV